MIELTIFSFFAGVLTVTAPCILPLIPVIIGASTTTATKKDTTNIQRPLIIITSLIVSIVLFTLILKVSTLLLGVPSFVWSLISGIIILLFGVNTLFPSLWERLLIYTNLHLIANRQMSDAQNHSGIKKDILLGAALGPVFNSCSPTYALIIAVLLPSSITTGLLYLSAYALGLGSILLVLSLFGKAVIAKVRWMSNPGGAFQKAIGVLFVVVGLMILFGIDKRIQTAILDSGAYKPVESIEKSFMAN